MRAAITGHVVLSTIHTNDAAGTIERLVDIGVEPYLVGSALKGVVSQRLVRRICPTCRTAYEASPEELADLGLPAAPKRILYKGTGCPDCYNSGYKGRAAVFEILIISRELRDLISAGATRAQIDKVLHAPGSGYVTLQENAANMVLEGITTVDEVNRVINAAD